jgi:hypothetical protein
MDWRSLFKPAVESRGRKSRTENTVADSRDECAELEPLLSLYNDGMASAPETRRVKAHLEQCETCRRVYFWMRATNEVLAHRPSVVPPAGMSSRIKAAVAAAAAGEQKPARARFVLRPAYAMAATILLAAIAWLPGHIFRTAQKGGGTKVAKTIPPVAPSILPPTVTPLPPAPSTSQPSRVASAHSPRSSVKRASTPLPAKLTQVARNSESHPSVIERPRRHEQPLMAHTAVVRRPVIEAKNNTSSLAVRRQPIIHTQPVVVARVPSVPAPGPSLTVPTPPVDNQPQPNTQTATTDTHEPDRTAETPQPVRVASNPAVSVVTDGLRANVLSEIRSHVKLRGSESIGSRFGKLSKVTMSSLHEDEPTDSAGSKYGYADMGSSF